MKNIFYTCVLAFTSTEAASHDLVRELNGEKIRYDCHELRARARSGGILAADEINVYGDCLASLHIRVPVQSSGHRVVPGSYCTLSVMVEDGGHWAGEGENRVWVKKFKSKSIPCPKPNSPEPTVMVRPEPEMKTVLFTTVIAGRYYEFPIRAPKNNIVRSIE